MKSVILTEVGSRQAESEAKLTRMAVPCGQDWRLTDTLKQEVWYEFACYLSIRAAVFLDDVSSGFHVD